MLKQEDQVLYLVDITKDVTANKTEYTKQTPKSIEPYTDTIKEEDVDQVVELIKGSNKPFIIVGGGCSSFRSTG